MAVIKHADAVAATASDADCACGLCVTDECACLGGCGVGLWLGEGGGHAGVCVGTKKKRKGDAKQCQSQ